MDQQAREAMATQAVSLREDEEKHSDTSVGEVRQQIQLIPLACIVTEEYQRVMNMRNVAGIVKHFDPAKLGVLVVSHRKDGTYAVLDGQHRLTALRKLGYTATN
ncbi:MAG: DUF6551 family protein, partial [Eubacteriales bacterium]|nr:DUF6551 family protein [Eubacteriales bacterium]